MRKHPRGQRTTGNISEPQATLLQALRQLKNAAASEVGELIHASGTSTHERLRRLVAAGYVRPAGSRPVNGRGIAQVFELRKDMQAMDDATFEAYIEQELTPPHMVEAEKASSRARVLVKDEAYVQFMRLNAHFMSTHRMAEQMGEASRTVRNLAEMLGLPIDEEEKDARADTISSHFPHIPIGTQIDPWVGGTKFHLPSPIPGITRITRHYAAE